MKPDNNVRDKRSNVTGNVTKMSIDEGAADFIMEVLSKMYGDPELAPIREYSTNAWDSHVEAGETRPIEVTLPQPMMPLLTIRDYGVGLNEDDIVNIYSKYGASTKRETNAQNGMLGIGCKSALAYTDQFTLCGFKDGVKTTVLVGRDDDGSSVMTTQNIEHGDYEDGVEVQIPVKRDNDIEDKAYDFFRFWPEGQVLVNGKPPRRIGADNDEDEGGNLNQNIWLDENTLLTNEVAQDLVVMGNVAYPLIDGEEPLFDPGRSSTTRRMNPRTNRWEYGSAWNAVCFVPIGAVNFAPSRESLMTTPNTKRKLAELRTHIEATRDASVRDQIAAATTAKEAQELLVRSRGIGFKQSDAQWNGRTVLLELKRRKLISPADPANDIEAIYATSGADDWASEDALKHSYLHINTGRYARKNGDRTCDIDLTAGELRIFTGFDGKHMTNVKRAKLELWASRQGFSTDAYGNNSLGHCVMVDKLTPDEKFWTDGWPIHNWEDVAAIELPTATTADGSTVRLKGSYDAYVQGSFQEGVPAAKLAEYEKKGLPLLWAHGNRWNAQGSRGIRSGAVELDKVVLVNLGANRIDKFCRDFPAALKVEDAARKAAERWQKEQDAEVVKACAIKELRGNVDILNKLKDFELKDPELNELTRLLSIDTKAYETGRGAYSAYLPSADSTKTADEVKKVLVRYPLLNALSGYAMQNGAKEHLVMYLNTAFAAKKGA